MLSQFAFQIIDYIHFNSIKAPKLSEVPGYPITEMDMIECFFNLIAPFRMKIDNRGCVILDYFLVDFDSDLISLKGETIINATGIKKPGKTRHVDPAEKDLSIQERNARRYQYYVKSYLRTARSISTSRPGLILILMRA